MRLAPGLQCLWDVRANEPLKENNLFFKGGTSALQGTVGNEAMWAPST
jgi:hypothetical protein